MKTSSAERMTQVYPAIDMTHVYTYIMVLSLTQARSPQSFALHQADYCKKS